MRMQEGSMLSAHELIEPKSASTSQTACGSAAMVWLRSMAATASRYAVGGHNSDETKGIHLERRYRRQMTTYKTVLVGTDGSESSLRAVERAGKIAADSDATLIIATG